MSSGLLDIQVLEETTSRISGLAKAIDKQVGVVEESSHGAQRAVQSQSMSPTKKLGHFQANVTAVLKVYELVEQATKRVYNLEEPIDEGVAAAGWPAYLARVLEAQRVHEQLAAEPDLQRFPQLADAASTVFNRGQANLQRYLRRLSKGVSIPLDEKVVDGREIETVHSQNFAYEDSSTLAKLVAQLDQLPEVSQGVDQSLSQLMDAYMAKSAQPVQSKSRKPALPAYQALIGELREVSLNAVDVLFAGDSAKQRQFSASIADFADRESKRGAELVAKQSTVKTGPKPGGPGGISTSTTSAPAPTSVTSGPGGQTMPSGAKRPSADALRGPPINPNGAPLPPQHHIPPPATQRLDNKANSTPPMPNSGFPESPRSSTTSGHTVPGTPYGSTAPGGTSAAPTGGSTGGSSPYLGTPSSNGPVTMSTTSVATQSGPVNPTQADWSVLDTVDQARHDPQTSPEESAKYKREGSALLMQVFSDIEIQCRKSPITSEFGVSGASIQFMKTSKNIASNSRGVEVVLSEVATRAYLTKPPPPWAAKSEPSPAARANPVSLYFSDCVECLYANSKQVSTEQSKDVTKSGVFLSCNLAAVEHFITDSNTETSASMRTNNLPNTKVMDEMGDVALQKFSKVMDASFKMYLTDWSKLAPNSLDSTMTGSAAQAKLSAKDREVVKDKFRVFNTEFDSLVERQRKYQVVDPTSRARMSQEVRKLIGPSYMRFYMKHKDGDFTKNIQKYVKYTPAQIESAVSF